MQFFFKILVLAFFHSGIWASSLGVALSPQDCWVKTKNSPRRGNCGFLLVIKRSRAGFLLSCFPSAHLSIRSTAFHGFDGSQGGLQCCNFILKCLETITARIFFHSEIHYRIFEFCSMLFSATSWLHTDSHSRQAKDGQSRSFFTVEGHVVVRDGHQMHVFPRGPECGEQTIADPPSLAYSCLCDDGETPRDLPCPLHPPLWWMGPGDWCSAFTLVLSETTCLELRRCALLQLFSILLQETWAVSCNIRLRYFSLLYIYKNQTEDESIHGSTLTCL